MADNTIKLPHDFCARIEATHPADHAEFLAAIGREPYLSVRLNRHKWQDGMLTLGEPVPWNADGFYLNDRPAFTLNPAFHAGAFYVQEASSMAYAVAINQIKDLLPQSPTCLDLCAAPGGKTTLMLSMLGERGIVVANEYVRQRAWILRENVAKWGCPSAIVTNRAAGEIGASGAQFDLITVDAPCSGEGMFRKDETAIAEWSTKAAADCAQRQRDILTDIWPALRPGGFMIYSTCTFNPDENERNMEWLVEEFGAEVVPIGMAADCGISTVSFNGGEGYAFLPHKVKGEGFFCCLVRKSADGAYAPPTPPKRSKQKDGAKDTIRETALGREFVSGCKTYALADAVVGFPADRATRMAALTSALSPILTGVPVCSVLKKRDKEIVSPAPELPLSMAFNPTSLPRLDVGTQTALKFLHGDADLDVGDAPDGWNAVWHEGLPLGLIKRMANRQNNYWPKEWRIRMNIS